MADLSDVQAADTVKIVGSDASGVEQTPVQATTKGELVTSDVLNTASSAALKTITTTASAANVSGSNLSGRKLLIIQAQTGNIVWGFSAGLQPFTLASGASLYLSVGENVTVYLRRTTGSGSVAVAELS